MNLNDNMAKEQAKRAGQIHLNAKIDALAEVIAEMDEEGYTLLRQVRGAILSRIETLASIKEDDDAK